jgi:hypothetical protein
MPYFRRYLSTQQTNSASQNDASKASADPASIDPVSCAKSILAKESFDLPSAQPASFGEPQLRQTGTALPEHSASAVVSLTALASKPSEVSPGATVRFQFALRNEETNSVVCSPLVTDFISNSGYRIPASTATFSSTDHSSKLSVPLLPKTPLFLDCSVKIPMNASVGSYSGLLTIAQAEAAPALLQFKVSVSHD